MTAVFPLADPGRSRRGRMDGVAGSPVTPVFAALESFFIAMPGMDRDNTVLRRIALVHRMICLRFPLVPVSRIDSAGPGVPVPVVAGAPFSKSGPRADSPRLEALPHPAAPVQS